MSGDPLHDEFLQAVREISVVEELRASIFAFRRRVRERLDVELQRWNGCSPPALRMLGDPLHFKFGQAVPEI